MRLPSPFLILFLGGPIVLFGQTSPTPDPSTPQTVPVELQQLQAEVDSGTNADSRPQPGVPHGEMLKGKITDSKIYPGITANFQVYVPAEYTPDKPACVMVHLDGIVGTDPWVLDNLIAKKQIPVIIEVGAASAAIYGDLPPQPPAGKHIPPPLKRWDRSFQYDSVNEDFPNYVLNEVLPKVETMTTSDGRAIHLSHNPNDGMAMGGSSGGIGAFNLAWFRPDRFSRVYSIVGSFVAFRGGNNYPFIVRKTEPKPIRVFLEDGSQDAWNRLFGNWYEDDVQLEAALEFAGYDVQHFWGVHAHDGKVGNLILPDVLRWLWRDYPTPIKAGISQNKMTVSTLLPDQNWQQIGGDYKAARGLASNPQGDVCFSDAPDHVIDKISGDAPPAAFISQSPAIGGEAFGPDGTLYGLDAENKKVVTLAANGPGKTIAEGIAGASLLVSSDSSIYVSEPGGPYGEPSNLWLIRPTGEKSVVDHGLASASGLAFNPTKTALFNAERTTHWIYNYVPQPDGTLAAKQRFVWLYENDIASCSEAQDLAMDTRGVLYVASGVGIQVCDIWGHVQVILPLPSPSGPVQSLCFGGPSFDILYATDGHKIFCRKLKVTGYSQWSAPMIAPSPGGL